jgi:hypothetical protein
MMNPIIQKKQASANINPNANANTNNTNDQICQYFNTLPTFIQENIKQTGVQFHSVQELQQVANQMLSQSNSQQ